MAQGAHSKKTGTSLVFAKNKRAFHDYEVLETIEAGIVLVGSEVKAIRDGKIQLSDAYALVKNGEIFLLHMKIQEYAWANQFSHTIERPRKLLLHHKEISKLLEETQQKGKTIVPLEVYQKDGRVKVRLGVCKGKKLYDKRKDLKEKDVKRELSRIVRTNS